ncbi:tRNA (cytidine(34)-2'-O)-methyltransferase [Thermochromatium tepidum]|jgi:Predicted rRNA methylase (SpoU class)|uniref:tRNA (cytidine(34)-2'-O)-methyltransferase n=1 Tax=Thermochromatium tepidum ATCC 43061 TaxID=316276 RepID=A0A6I6EAJ2_THETI|nr:tRNA (cytidine(34)-2'-O)-methyltransferase [Thermochromatium tepidum]QGU31949.1 tRNA (uridine(34)/cytosine(34)/5-carboxymethylaminomethyluridine(34)-2'-O)-methyltransferase TrmL [Thermochromatium tepidum ATCC 43061]
MFDIILYEPEIPPNTGNVMRLTANLGARLHLIEPLGFSLDDRLLRRAGLDYREWAEVRVHPSLTTCLDRLTHPRLLSVSTRGRIPYVEPDFRPGDAFLFGPETRGLPDGVLESVPEQQRLRIPMRPGNRSLNLSNAVAVVLYEAWRQQGFAGAAEMES